MYFIRVKRATIMLATMPNAIMSAVAVPNFSTATETMASLFGMMPCTLKACSKIPPNGFKELSKMVAPPPSTIKPRMVLTVPLMMSGKAFF